MLIHIGYPKTGTSWLQTGLFAAQPGKPLVSALTAQELSSDIDAYIGGDRDIVSCGSDCIISKESLTMLNNTHRHAAPLRLAAAFPAADILIVLREQISSISSTYIQYNMDSSNHSSRNVGIDAWASTFRTYWDYSVLYEAYCAAFGKERVHVAYYEGLRDNPLAFAEGLCDHFGLVMPSTVPGIVNRRDSKCGQNVIQILWLLHRIAPIRELVRVAFSPVMRQRIAQIAITAIGKPLTPTLSDEHETSLRTLYQESNNRLRKAGLELPDEYA